MCKVIFLSYRPKSTRLHPWLTYWVRQAKRASNVNNLDIFYFTQKVLQPLIWMIIKRKNRYAVRLWVSEWRTNTFIEGLHSLYSLYTSENLSNRGFIYINLFVFFLLNLDPESFRKYNFYLVRNNMWIPHLNIVNVVFVISKDYSHSR